MTLKASSISLLSILVSSYCFAALDLYNFAIDDLNGTVSFDIIGTIEASDPIGTTDPDTIYIGSPGDTDWITGAGINRTISNDGSATRDIRTTAGLYQTYAFGDYIELRSDDFTTFLVGDSINASVSINGGTLIGANLDFNSVIVTIGYDNGIPFPDDSVGIGGVVPEPKQTSILLGLAALGTTALTRSRRRA